MRTGSKILFAALLLLAGAAPGDKPAAVVIKGLSFSPADLTVSPGATVTWTNADDRDHEVKAADGTFASGNLSPGKTFVYTFKSVGTYTYGCSLHPRMKGKVTVAVPK